MRTVTEHAGRDGTTYRVRFRQGGMDTSRTFRAKGDATTFAAILDGEDGVARALEWLATREKQHDTADLATYLEHYIKQLTGVTVRTKDDYRAQYRRYLTSLGPLPLSLITKAHVAGIVNDMEADGLSPKTIKNVINMLSSIMALAVDEGVVDRNPCRKVRLPKVRQEVDDDEDAEAKFLTHEEFGMLLRQIPDHWKPLVIFLVGTGLRWSEATALQTRHVSLTNGTVQVRQAWKKRPPDKERGIVGGWIIGPPKSEKSRRTVNAAVQALAVVRPLLRPGRAFVFVTRQGKPIQHSNFFNRVWKPATIRLSICDEHMNPKCRCGTTKPNTCPVHTEKDARGHQILPVPCGCAGTLPFRPGIHDLRHTHASWLIAEGKSLEQVQDQLGHESILTTRGVYGHLLPALGVETGRAASAALAAALGAMELPELEAQRAPRALPLGS